MTETVTIKRRVSGVGIFGDDCQIRVHLVMVTGKNVMFRAHGFSHHWRGSLIFWTSKAGKYREIVVPRVASLSRRRKVGHL